MGVITKEVQEVIDYVLKENPNINFKICKECERKLPAHEIFFTKHTRCKFGVNSKCKECTNRDFSFYDVVFPWYGSKEEFIANYRKMSVEQIAKYYNKPISTIVHYSKSWELNKFEIVKNLTEEEIIFMYKSLLNGEINIFTNGVFNYDDYIIVLIRYMINNILKWNREDICKYFSSQTLKDNKLGGLLGIKRFNPNNYLLKAFSEYKLKTSI